MVGDDRPHDAQAGPDPATDGRPRGHSVGEQLFAHEDADQAHVHPIKLMGDLYQTRTVLRCLEDALWRHPLHDCFGDEQMDALAEPQARTYDAVNEARRILEDEPQVAGGYMIPAGSSQ